jgi:HD-like signal output (HDOD) protein/CheY-like chemotaxis protein
MTDRAETIPPDRASVLFVDDEEDVLAAIRSSLRKERKRFDFRFAVGGAAALAQLEDRPAAIIVSDMRMPGMNGAELLERAKVACPESVRIVLSGEAEPKLVLRSIPVAHQWLSKPCDRDTLLAAIEGAVRYSDLLVEPALKRAISDVDALASPPAIYTELLAMAADASTAVEEIAVVTGTDPAVAAKLIQLANSAFSGGVPVTDMHGAILPVGLENLCYLVLSVELLERWNRGVVIPGLDIATNARLSGLAATLAAAWAPSNANVTRLVALFHNVGLLVESQALPERLSISYATALAADTRLVTSERAEHGVSHLELGGHLLSIWGVPSQVVLAVVGSHDPMTALARDGTVNDAVRLGVRAARHHFGADVGAPHRVPTTPAEQSLIEGALADSLIVTEVA